MVDSLQGEPGDDVHTLQDKLVVSHNSQRTEGTEQGTEEEVKHFCGQSPLPLHIMTAPESVLPGQVLRQPRMSSAQNLMTHLSLPLLVTLTCPAMSSLTKLEAFSTALPKM